MKAFIFDIDGTLADCAHRQHHVQGPNKDWPAFFKAMADDTPVAHMVTLLRILDSDIVSARDHGVDPYIAIVYTTGRPEEYRQVTHEWMLKYDIPVATLYMRRTGDFRPDDVVKAEMLMQMRKARIEPIMAFDDRVTVVNMWRKNGVPCAQVAEGDF